MPILCSDSKLEFEMIRTLTLVGALSLSTAAYSAQQYCEVETNEDYGTRIVRIPYGIAIITEESPLYCELNRIGKQDPNGSSAFKCYNHPEDFGIKVQFINGVENIFLWDKRFVACEGSAFLNSNGNILQPKE